MTTKKQTSIPARKKYSPSKEDKHQVQEVKDLLELITKNLDTAEKSKSRNEFDVAIEEAYELVSDLEYELTLLRIKLSKLAIFDNAWKIAADKGHVDGYGGSEYRSAKAKWIQLGRKTTIADLP